MRRCLMPWFLVIPLATLGVVAGHGISYALTGTPSTELHAYLSHVPQVALLLTLLCLLGASFVERGNRIALWPFPTVAIAGFVAQEHLERLAHSGSIPFLLDKPFFLVGLALQAFVATAAWLLARLLIRVVGVDAGSSRGVRDPIDLALPALRAPAYSALPSGRGPRAPPFDR